MSKILEDRTEDNRLPLLSHLTMGLSFIRSSIMLTYGTLVLLTYRGIKLFISGLEETFFSIIPVGLSCTGGSFVVLYTPGRNIFFFTERVGALGVASWDDTMGPLLLLVRTCSAPVV